MSAAHTFAGGMLARLETMVDSPGTSIGVAAAAIAGAIGSGHRVWIAETSHGLHDEVTGRAGGKRLNEVADIEVDLGGRYGDTELDFTCGDRSFSVIPGSGIAAMLAMWMIFTEATELLCECGTPPLTWDSMQMPGVHAANLQQFAEYRRSRKAASS
jgi:uncharacterized phosphosugar-binding protein